MIFITIYRSTAKIVSFLIISLGALTSLPASPFPQISFETVAGNGSFNRPVHITHAGDGSDRLFVVEQDGVIRIIQDGNILPSPFLDIQTQVRGPGDLSGGNEQGLLSLAFPPNFAMDQHVYVYYTSTNAGETVVSRFDVHSLFRNRIEPKSEQVLFTHSQPFANHNGGQLAFGPNDGYLYVGLGDGGSGNDPLGAGQNLQNLLGKILRLDVESVINDSYQIPVDNPFVGNAAALDEIWAYGLRNPWRFSFDRLTGDLFIGDVGQVQWEEVDFQAASSTGGENYGWKPCEGSYNRGSTTTPCSFSAPDLVHPIAEYSHSFGCSITGGHIHRGAPEWSNLHGTYFYADYCTGNLWGLKQQAGGSWTNELLTSVSYRIYSFGEDECGNIYLGNNSGAVLRMVDHTITNDTDGDLLYDQFESYYNLTNVTDAVEDFDEDLMYNLDEQTANTDPTNANSRLVIDATLLQNNTNIVLHWQSAPCQVYEIGTALSPVTPTHYATIATNIPATPPQNSYTTTVSETGNRQVLIRIQPDE